MHSDLQELTNVSCFGKHVLKLVRLLLKSISQHCLKPRKSTIKRLNLLSTSSENAFDEIELLGFPLCNPFELLEHPLKTLLKAKELSFLQGKDY